jgi:hypothetical protein
MKTFRCKMVRRAVLAAALTSGCFTGDASTPDAGTDASRADGSLAGDGPEAADVGASTPGFDGSVGAVVIAASAASRTARTGTWSVNYWTWPPSFGDPVSGTDTLMAALGPTFMRIGGYNNDANTPDPFDDAQMDLAATYARAIGAEPILQVPLLEGPDGQPPTAATAAAMVTYANVTNSYGVKYFSIGNEPDLYPTQGSIANPSAPAIAGYTPAMYCASATSYVAAMKSVDPTIKIVGPDLSYQYQPPNDWLTPILQGCGDLFDVVSIHRYPYSAAQVSLAGAASDAAAFRSVLASVRSLMQAAGQGDKPLALTEMNIVYDATVSVVPGSPATVPAALWLADILGSSLNAGLWTAAVWDISDPDNYSLGLVSLTHIPRPEYYAFEMYQAHFGTTLLDVTAAPTGISAYASRNPADTATEVIAINWNSVTEELAFQVTGLDKAPGAATFPLPTLTLAAIEIPDDGEAAAWIYGSAQDDAGTGPQPWTADGTVAGPGDGSADSAGQSD